MQGGEAEISTSRSIYAVRGKTHASVFAVAGAFICLDGRCLCSTLRALEGLGWCCWPAEVEPAADTGETSWADIKGSA